MSSSYEAAGNGRRSGNWYAPSTGPNSALMPDFVNLRNRSRAGIRNNPWISRAIDSLVANEIGTGIIPRSCASDADIRSIINTLWAKSEREFDVEGNLDIYGLQAQLARSRRTSGEVFVRRRRRAIGDLAVPIQFQVLESEFVPHSKNETLSNGNKIVAGIEFNKRGKRVAYWMHTSHPGDDNSYISEPIRIRSSDVIHHFSPSRPGQVRGEIDGSRSLLKAYTFDSYDDAELVRKQTRAPYTGFLSREKFDENDYKFNPFTGEAIEEDSDGVPTLDAQPGTILSGLPGEKLDLFNGDDGGEGYADFMRQQLLAIASGYNIPYELLSGDWSKVNDRLVRSILNEFHRHIEMAQDHLVTHQICNRIWLWWMDEAVLSGAINLPGYAENKLDYQSVEWRPQAWPYVHPEQDVNAKIKAINASLSSRDAEVAKTGWDAEEIDRQNVESEKRLKTLRESAGLSDEQDEKIPKVDSHYSEIINKMNSLAEKPGKPDQPVINVDARTTVKNSPQPINVHIPETKTPDITVNVEPDVINLNTPDVVVPETIVNIPKSEPIVNIAPTVVNVDAPTVNVEIPARKTETTIARDSSGNIVSATQIEDNA